MENVSHFDQIINLGEKIVRELDLADGCNTLGRWMAHDLAEHIIFAKAAKSKKQQELHKMRAQEVANLLKAHITPEPINNQMPKIKIQYIIKD